MSNASADNFGRWIKWFIYYAMCEKSFLLLTSC